MIDALLRGDRLMEVTSGEVLCRVQDYVATLTLNRPEVLNSTNRVLRSKAAELAAALDADDDVRVIVITGAGDRAFSAGADLRERSDMSDREVETKLREPRWTTQILSVSKPTIAAVNGYALGGGTELALACDLRIASERAVFALVEITRAIIPGAAGTQLLPRLVGPARAKEMIFFGKKIDAFEAERIGLVNRVVPHEQLMDAAYSWAHELCRLSPHALRMAKRAINLGSQTDLWTGLAIETETAVSCIRTRDRVEGLKAFREKREPVYTGE